MINDELNNERSSLIDHRLAILPTRLIIDPPQPGVWNMAVDEALLDSAINDGVATLRFYQWSEPTLSLGYFQKLADRELHEASRGCPVVRRRSGGGAILHDQELTYSLALPASVPQVREPEQIYRRTHEALLAALAELAPATKVHSPANLCSAAIAPAAGDEPFLCFQRRARCDVLLVAEEPADTIDGKHKVCGSAQRKHRGAVLQHGSLLLSRSPAAPELPGVAELIGSTIEAGDAASAWRQTLADALGLETRSGTLTSEEKAAAEGYTASHFGAAKWVGRR